MNKKFTKLLSVFIIAGAIGAGAAFAATGCNNKPDDPGKQEQTVTVTEVKVTASKTTAKVGEKVTLSVEVKGENNSSQEVTWAITEGSDKATLSGTELTLKKEGTVKVQATSKADTTKKGEVTITVQAATQPQPKPTVTSVTASADKTTAKVGETVTLTATVVGENNPSTDVTWAITEGSDKATLAGNVLTLTAEGTVKVQATSVADTTKKSEEITITIETATQPATPTVTSVTASADKTTAKVGETVTLTATVVGENNPSTDVTWAITAGDDKATLADNVLTLTAEGTVKVQATSVADTTKKSEEITITIETATQPATPTVTSVTASADKTTAKVGETVTLTATVVGENNPSTDVTWAITAGDDKATLAGNVLTLTAEGTVKVQATSVADTTKKSEELTITIEAATQPATPTVTSVTASADKTTAKVGETVTLSATVVGENNPSTDVTWAITAGDDKATLADNVLTLTAEGTVKVQATSVADTTKKSEEITITIEAATQPATPTVTSVTASADKTTAKVGETVTLTATVVGENNPSTDVTWAITAGDDKATLAGNVLTLTAEGTVKVQATSVADTTKKSEEITITIEAATQPATPTVTSVTASADKTTAKVGETVTLTATVVGENNPSTDVTWAITEGSDKATLADNVLTLTAEGTVKVQATSVADTTKKSDEITITIEAATQPATPTVTSVTASADKTTAKVGETVTLSATVVGENNPSTDVTWAITEGSDKATLAGNVLTLTAEGTVKVQATSVADTTKKSDEITITIEASTQPATKYTVTFKNGEETLTSVEVEEGAKPAYTGETPTKAATAQYTYTFSGWTDGTRDYAPDALPEVTGALTLTATFSETVNKYTVTWMNGETVIETDTEVPYGTTPTYDGETPTKAATAQYTYTFSGWDKEVAKVTGNVTYTAQFTETVNQYTYTFYDDDGTKVLKTATVDYDTAIEKPADPTKADTAEHKYHFDGWYTAKEGGEKVTEFGKIGANVNYYARYTEVHADEFLVEFNMNGHGTAIAKASTVGKKVAEPTAPEATGYQFGGWFTEAACTTAFDFATELAENTTLYAKWTPIEYTITFKDANGVVGEPVIFTVETEQITAPTVPEKTGYDGAWGAYDLTKAENQIVEAVYTPIVYNITYVLGEGATNAEGNPATYTIETPDFEFADPTREGYKFNGWTIDFEGTPSEITGVPEGNTGDLTLTADWLKYITVTVNDVNDTAGNPLVVIKEDYTEGATPTIEELNKALAGKKPGYVVNAVYTEYTETSKVEYDDSALEADTVFVVTFKLSADGWANVFTNTAANRNYTVTTKVLSDTPDVPDVVMSLIEADNTHSYVHSIEPGQNGVVKETYRVYGETAITEYFELNGKWYYRTITDATFDTYDKYAANGINNHLNLSVFGSEAVYGAVVYDEDSGYSYTDTQNGVVYNFTFVNGLLSVIDAEAAMEESSVMNMKIELTKLGETTVTLPEGAVEYTKYAELTGREDNRIAEDFSTTTTVKAFTDWKAAAAGVYTSHNSAGADNTHYVTVADGWAMQVDEGNGETHTVIDFGYIQGTVEGCLTFKFEAGGNSWTPIQFIGTNATNSNSEVFGLRIDGDVIKYRVNGAVSAAQTNIALDTKAHELYFKLEAGRLTVTIDDKPFVTDLDAGIESLCGIKAVSSNSGAKLVHLDNIAINAQLMSVDNYKLIVLEKLVAEISKYGTYDKEAKTLTASVEYSRNLATLNEKYVAAVKAIEDAAVAEGATLENLNDALASAVADFKTVKSDAVLAAEELAAAKEQAKTELSTYKGEGYDNLTDTQKAEVDAAIGDGTNAGYLKDGYDAIDKAENIAGVEAALSSAKGAIDNKVSSYNETPQTVYEKASGMLDEHITAQYAANGINTEKDTKIAGLVAAAKGEQMTAIAAARDAEGATAQSVYDAITAAQDALTTVIANRAATEFKVTFTDTEITQTVKYGEAATKPETDPVKENAKFKGWYVSAAEDAAEYDFTQQLYDDNVTVYAHWQDADITITFMVDGVTLKDGENDKVVKAFSGDKAADIVLPTVYVSGKTLSGWTVQGTDAALADSDLANAGAIVLTATTTPKSNEELAGGEESYIVSELDNTDGSHIESVILSDGKLVKVETDDYVVEGANVTSAVYKNVNMADHFTTLDGTKTLTKAIQSTNAAVGTDTKSIIITAKEDIKVYVYAALSDSNGTGGRIGTLNYKLNGGEKTVFAEVTSKALLTGTLTLSLKCGDVLEVYGSVDKNSSGSRLYLYGVEAQLPDSFTNMTVQYFTDNAGTTAEGEPQAWSSLKDLSHEAPTAPEGTKFAGWATVPNAEAGDAKELSEITLTPGDDLKLYPVFATEDVTINFFLPTDVTDGAHTYGETADSTTKGFSEATVDEPAQPTFEGLTFDGWYVNVEGVETKYDFSTPLVAGILNLYAKFVKIDVVSVEFAEDNPEAVVTEGKSITLKAVALSAQEGVSPSNTKLEWSIEVAETVATINKDTGELTVKSGAAATNATITVTVKSVEFVDADTTPNLIKTIDVTVNEAPAYSSWALDFAGTDKVTTTTNLSDGDKIDNVLTVVTAASTKLHASGYLTTKAGSVISFEVKATATLSLKWNGSQPTRTYEIKNSEGTVVGSGSMSSSKVTHENLVADTYTIHFAGGEHKITNIALDYPTK